MYRSSLIGFHNRAKLKYSKFFLSFTSTHILSPSRMWELAETGSHDAELTLVKCWKHKHEKIPIYQSQYFLSCMVLVADIFPSLRHVILCYNSKEYIWNTNLDCLNEDEGSYFILAFLLRFFSLCWVQSVEFETGAEHVGWEWEYP